MRPDVAADLQHHLSVRQQRNRARVSAPKTPVDERRDATAESREARSRQRLAPDGEELADRRPCSAWEFDDAGGRCRPHRERAARTSNERAVAHERFRHPDPGREQEHAPVCKQLDVRSSYRAFVRGAAEPSHGLSVRDPWRSGSEPELRADADRRRNRLRDRSAAEHDGGEGRNDAADHSERIVTSRTQPAGSTASLRSPL